MRLPSARPVRPGLSLLEVLVALAIFLLSLAALSQLVNLASDRAIDTERRNQAGRICQSKLNEVMWGSIPLSTVSEQQDEDNPDFNWSLDAEQGQVAGLWNITITVSWTRPDGSNDSVAVSQMLLDPSIRGNTQDSTAITGTPATGGGGGGGGGGATPAGGGAAPAGGGAAAAAKPAAAPAAAPKTNTTPAAAPKAAAPAAAPKTPAKGG
jgi:prepilin-type N-terminal cleavage/methylation domain-containing protein